MIVIETHRILEGDSLVVPDGTRVRGPDFGCLTVSVDFHIDCTGACDVPGGFIEAFYQEDEQ